MSRARLALALAALLGAGCTQALDVAGVAWTRPDADLARVTTDQIECLRAVSDAGQTPDAVVGGVADAARFVIRERLRVAAYDRCMAGKGYRRAAR